MDILLWDTYKLLPTFVTLISMREVFSLTIKWETLSLPMYQNTESRLFMEIRVWSIWLEITNWSNEWNSCRIILEFLFKYSPKTRIIMNEGGIYPDDDTNKESKWQHEGEPASVKRSLWHAMCDIPLRHHSQMSLAVLSDSVEDWLFYKIEIFCT